ncbi:MAG: hypothetical protein KDC70_00940 [Saprospiraceae bacterium]|nr:hypothetical protein [Saprospiraceae bacterium]
MLNRKLLEVLRHLGTLEKKRLRLFLLSPYFNSTSAADDIVRLYDLIVQYDADEECQELSKESVFGIFFPDRVFKENTKSPLDSMTTDLFALVRRFLAQTELERESGEVEEHLALAKFYRKFAYEERFWQVIGSLRKVHEKSPWRDARHYFKQFKIEEEELSFRSLYNSFEDDVNLIAVHTNLDRYYSIMKLDFACALTYQGQFAPIEMPPSIVPVEELLNQVSNGGPFDLPVNHIYKLLMQMLRGSATEENLHALEHLIEQYEAEVPFEKRKEFSAYHQFLWTQLYSTSGNDQSLQNTFAVYKKHLEMGYCYFDDMLPLTDFRNLTIIGLKLGEVEWVKNFLDRHPPERICSTRYPAEVCNLNMAEYHFYLKQYDEAQEMLSYKLFENPVFSILSDVLLVKIYFETQNELLEFRMKALDQKVRRAKLSQGEKNRYLNFLRKLDKIVKYTWQPRNNKREKLIEEIKSTREIIAREWLLEKLEK